MARVPRLPHFYREKVCKSTTWIPPSLLWADNTPASRQCGLMLTADKMQRAFKPVVTDTLEGNNWHKLTEPSVDRGRTTFPRKPADQERLGVRFDYDGEDTGIGGTVYHKYQIQVNAGDKIPPTFKTWRENNGGTHAVMGNLYVKKGGTKADVEAALRDAIGKMRRT